MDGEAHNHEVVVEEQDAGDPTRFVDDWKTSAWFEKQGKLYACTCGALLRVANGEGGARVCTRACGVKPSRDEPPRLFLSRRVAGVEFYAYNRAHLEYMARIVAATQRVGTPCAGCPICNCSIMRKLPKEILSASNREKVLRAIELMTAELDAAQQQ
jgi:hypothetical protein